jgi:putative SOS response-associated peptidase YedK
VCGRFTLTTPGEIVAEAFGLDEAPSLDARYNIAPTQPVAMVRVGEGRRHLDLMKWGLVPVWSQEPRGRTLLINARADGLVTRPSFREAFARRRCLIPADGFYEWKAVAGSRRKQPYLIRMRDGGLFAFAGLWEPSHPGDPESRGTCAIVTTEPNSLVREIHDRMPAILPRSAWALWLDPARRDPAVVAPLLRPHPAEEMVATRVGPTVNSAANESSDCARPDPGPEESL